MKPRTVTITPEDEGQLIGIYKDVFRGHPWHEDLICANSNRQLGDSMRCMVQYTRRVCEKYDPNQKKRTVENDCRSGYRLRLDKAAREGIALLPEGGLDRCVGCGDELKLIQFYPDFADHQELIAEAIREQGFVGYMINSDGKLVGFGWGYGIPQKRTVSVNFPAVTPMLEEAQIRPEEAFYFAEAGVAEEYQHHHLGSMVIAKMLKAALDRGHSTHVTRTINPFVHIILERLFSGMEGRELFKDPERGSTWFSWDFKDFNVKHANKLIANLS